MKILLISNFWDGTGYSQAAINKALALDVAGIDVVVRNLKLNNVRSVVPQRILELEAKDDRNCDAVIQYTLPHLMSYNSKAGINIGCFDYETSSFAESSWSDKLNAMDVVWATSKSQKQACINSGVKVPISIVPHAVDVSKYQQGYEPLKLPNYNNEFVFYFVGEFVRRKNINDVIKAFNIEFDREEPVKLLLKTSIPGKNEKESIEIINKISEEVKQGLKIYNKIEAYKREIIITERLDEVNLMRVHKSAHCFVTASHGEGFCYPIIDALGVGNPVIAPIHGGLDEVLSDYAKFGMTADSLGVNYSLDRAFGAFDTFNEIYTSNELWANVNIDSLCHTMREMYTNKTRFELLRKNAILKPYNFSFEKVGQIMKDTLNGITSK